jgi:hypothetical protein
MEPKRYPALVRPLGGGGWGDLKKPKSLTCYGGPGPHWVPGEPRWWRGWGGVGPVAGTRATPGFSGLGTGAIPSTPAERCESDIFSFGFGTQLWY